MMEEVSRGPGCLDPLVGSLTGRSRRMPVGSVPRWRHQATPFFFSHLPPPTTKLRCFLLNMVLLWLF